jgi:hypothetical protein
MIGNFPSRPSTVLHDTLHARRSDIPVNASMMDILDAKMCNVAARKCEGQNVSEFIEEMKGQALVSSRTGWTSSTLLHQMSAGHFLDQMICIFQHAFTLLKDQPNCAMTDGTLKIPSPDTLKIIHLIIANESIPIGFALRPRRSLNDMNLFTMQLSRSCSETMKFLGF